MSAGGRRAAVLTISGTVQGVGYRAFVEREARGLALAGSVRNRRDGAVEAVVVGPAAAVEALVAACRRGPSAAVVGDVVVEDYAGPIPTGFRVLPTR